MKLGIKKLIYCYAIGALALVIILVSMFDTKFKEIPIQESFIQESIQKLLPIIKADTIIGLYAVGVKLSDVNVIRLTEDSIKLVAVGSVLFSSTDFFQEGKALIQNMFKKKKNKDSEIDTVKKAISKMINFTLLFSGLPDYDNGENSIYLTIHDLQVTELKLQNLDVFKDSKGYVTATVVKVAKMYLDRFPLYKLPNDFKGAMVHSSVKEVEFQEQKIIIHFSLFGLFGGMIWWFICFLVAFIISITVLIVIAFNPRLFVFVEVVKEIR